MPFPSSSRPNASTSHTRSTMDAQQIPIEIFQQILENVPRNTLASAARANTSFNEVSEKLLYRQLELTSAEQAKQCFRSIETKPSAAQSVREVIIMIPGSRGIVATFGPYLAKSLQSLTQITALHLAIEGPYLPALNGCTFPRLKTFSSIADLSPNPIPLSEFLARHPTITSLCLGGDALPVGPNSSVTLPFTLPSNALPALASYMGSRRLAPALVSGRPVQRVTLAWHSPNVELEVECIIPRLSLTSTPILSFSVATPGWSSVLLRALATYLPRLQSLRMHNISSDFHNEAEIYTTLSNVLSSFPDLSRLELPCHRNIRTILPAAEEMVAAKRWGSQAPRLQTISFPSSRAWRRVDKGNWEPLR